MLIRIIGMGLVYASILYISNTFGAEVYGRYALIQTLIQALILFFSLGLRTSIVKLTSDIHFFNVNPLNNYLKKVLIVLLVSSLVCSILLVLLKEWVAIKVFKDQILVEYLGYTALFIVFAIFHSVLSEFIRSKERFLEYALYIYVLPPLLFIILMVSLRNYIDNESFIILSYLLSFLLICIALLFYLPFKKINHKVNYSYKRLFSLSLPMMFSALFLFLSNWTDIFMLGILSSKSEVGIYNSVFKL